MRSIIGAFIIIRKTPPPLSHKGENVMKKWYAVKKDRNDTDITKGSRDRAEAERMARGLGQDAFIEVIADGASPECVGEIAQEEFETKE